MNIPTAQKARDQVNQGLYALAQKQAAEIETAIQGAISKGHSCVSMDGIIEARIRITLEALGYQVESGCHYNESHYTISWK